MTDQPSRIEFLFQRMLQRECTLQELEEFYSLLPGEHAQSELDGVMKSVWDAIETYPANIPSEKMFRNIQLAKRNPGPVRRLRTWWAAAAILILLGLGSFLWKNYKNASPPIARVNDVGEIKPASGRAVLQIGKSRPIHLSNDQTGMKVGSLIASNDGERMADSSQHITLSTPRGGRFKAVLPDGSTVWLNAASSIQFPSTFNGDQRQVTVTGEVYLEIAKNKSKPFIVNVDGQSSIEVLGTGFNVNAYADDGVQRTTLISGSVKVFPDTASLNRHGKLLQPGQQALVSEKKITTRQGNIGQVLAWKNDCFDFTGLSFQSFMKEVERWYDIDVKYTGKAPLFKLEGKMDRGVTLSGLIRFLQSDNVHMRLEGRTLIVGEK